MKVLWAYSSNDDITIALKAENAKEGIDLMKMARQSKKPMVVRGTVEADGTWAIFRWPKRKDVSNYDAVKFGNE